MLKDFTPVYAMKTERRHYSFEGKAKFILKAISDCVIEVSHREQKGWIGINRGWNASRPYAQTTCESSVSPDSINAILTESTPDAALNTLCRMMLADQRRADSKRINPEGRRRPTKQVLGEFFDSLPR